jgi:hypothetical protein
MTWSAHALAVALAAAVLALAGSAAVAAPQPPAARHCFFVHQWTGWSAPDGDTLYLRVGLRDVYRVDLTPGSHARKYPDQHLVNRVRGPSTICSHLDLQLTLSDSLGFEQPLIARSIVKLTPDQVAAIPRKHLP